MEQPVVSWAPAVTLKRAPHLVHKNPNGNRYLPLVGSNCWTIGRNEDNNFVLSDRWISRNHAMLQCNETGEFYLIDLGSRNGSFVNGRRVTIPVTLHDRDRLTFGETELSFYCPTNKEEEEPNPEDPDSQDFTATAALYVRRLISVMVVDIRNFTVLTRQLDEKVLSEVIGTWFRNVGNIIRDHGSWVDKYIGDAVMAVWFHNSEKASNDEVVQIVSSLEALYRATEDINKSFPLPFPLRIAAGVNTGHAMVGNTGSGDCPDYTALGDTVNAAFRLESATKEIGRDIALGETTAQYLSGLGPGQKLFEQYKVHLKGYDTPTVTYGGYFADLQELLGK